MSKFELMTIGGIMGAANSRRSFFSGPQAEDRASNPLFFMRILSRVFVLPVFLGLAALSAFSQQKSPLNNAAEPFAIRPGSSFSASGGAANIANHKASK